MSTISPPPAKRPIEPEVDPFRFGWRYVKVTRPDGSTELDQIPLTLEDVLHPEEGDFIVQTDKHRADWVYLHEVFRARLADDPTAVVLSDCRVAWDVAGLRAHGPDVAVFLGVGDR